MNVAWEITQKREAYVDEEVGTAACNHPHADGRDCIIIPSLEAQFQEIYGRLTEDCYNNNED